MMISCGVSTVVDGMSPALSEIFFLDLTRTATKKNRPLCHEQPATVMTRTDDQTAAYTSTTIALSLFWVTKRVGVADGWADG